MPPPDGREPIFDWYGREKDDRGENGAIYRVCVMVGFTIGRDNACGIEVRAWIPLDVANLSCHPLQALRGMFFGRVKVGDDRRLEMLYCTIKSRSRGSRSANFWPGNLHRVASYCSFLRPGMWLSGWSWNPETFFPSSRALPKLAE